MADIPRPVTVLSRALDQARAALTTLDPEDLDLPTHCGDWTVRDLVGHLVAAPGNFLAMARGEEVDWSAVPDVADDQWAQHFRADADRLVEHWADRSEEEAGMADWQSAEIGVHTWDLLRATGHSMPLDPEVAERGLAFLQQGLTDENRAGAFGPPVSVPDDALPYDRLVAFAGRDPRA
ncbi:TIGR03086 family protein [Nocardioides sp. zg-1308]|uniref:TIGR03086 family metal-binding protein n=1 Tax=Nocardioides renjunii TaxID=3095075 RepID=A0ABU5KGP1_9ACTN|nr:MULTISPECIES: TIGR03086 family metal-binding protein [unclassified Nocardioides]MDZ5664125.1 TIGR03086 family metal-binding protein [Nocardioides sp. S-58]NPD04762.1 TIGR03086 family protein [Nocardioides sp. zg-1308]